MDTNRRDQETVSRTWSMDKNDGFELNRASKARQFVLAYLLPRKILLFSTAPRKPRMSLTVMATCPPLMMKLVIPAKAGIQIGHRTTPASPAAKRNPGCVETAGVTRMGEGNVSRIYSTFHVNRTWLFGPNWPRLDRFAPARLIIGLPITNYKKQTI